MRRCKHSKPSSWSTAVTRWLMNKILKLIQPFGGPAIRTDMPTDTFGAMASSRRCFCIGKSTRHRRICSRTISTAIGLIIDDPTCEPPPALRISATALSGVLHVAVDLRASDSIRNAIGGERGFPPGRSFGPPIISPSSRPHSITIAWPRNSSGNSPCSTRSRKVLSRPGTLNHHDLSASPGASESENGKLICGSTGRRSMLAPLMMNRRQQKSVMRQHFTIAANRQSSISRSDP